MVLSAIDAEPVFSRPPASVGVRISTGERRGFGPSVPSSTRASLHYARSEGSVNSSSPKLVQLIGSSLTRADEKSLNFLSAATSS